MRMVFNSGLVVSYEIEIFDGWKSTRVESCELEILKGFSFYGGNIARPRFLIGSEICGYGHVKSRFLM